MALQRAVSHCAWDPAETQLCAAAPQVCWAPRDAEQMLVRQSGADPETAGGWSK